MPLICIDGIDDLRVSDFRVVSDPELMCRRRLFVVEGQLAVERLLLSRFRVRSLLVTESAYQRLRVTLDRLNRETEVFLTDAAGLREVTGFRFHRGCLALGERSVATTSSRLVSEGCQPIVALEALSDPDNVGSIFRSAAAFGATGVLLSPTCADPLYRKAIRTSMGATLQVPFLIDSEWPNGLTAIHAGGRILVGLTPDPTAVDLETFAADSKGVPMTLLFGNEGVGLSREVLDCCDVLVRIALEESTDSLNVAISAAIVLQRFGSIRWGVS
ncbi:MAG: RNA methyltransferase [Acidobacteriota bacterium]|nr:RNA methyltransferase [Acidobacteriota bacterium]